MSSYENFSRVYDKFMEDTPYDLWIEYIESIWKKFGFEPKLVAELGCGTGNITQRLSDKGYDMIGIDNSQEMLMMAKQKAEDSGKSILYLNQDMREFELYGTVDSIICLCDGINYILESNELFDVFKLVNNYLEPGGLFIFDINTVYKFKNILGGNSFGEADDDAAYIWENYFDEDKMINEYYVNFFIKDNNTGLYERFEECHYEKGYLPFNVKALLEKAGLEVLGIFDGFSFDEPKNDSQRIYFVAKEKMK